jgi:hypothetical protein
MAPCNGHAFVQTQDKLFTVHVPFLIMFVMAPKGTFKLKDKSEWMWDCKKTRRAVDNANSRFWWQEQQEMTGLQSSPS